MSDLRHQPVQARATKRLEAIESAAHAALRLFGRDRLTTKHVAAIAGCSIGTVYRYFPDRIAILDRIWPERDMTVPGQPATPVVGEEATVTGTVIEMSDGTVLLGVGSTAN